MFVKEITLKGYIRLSNLNNFNLIKVKFTKKIQAILGTNGSGKSSFIEELSPLPAEAKNFTKDGYKEIIYIHKGKTYVLKSSFNPVVHSFLVDDEELNPGGTITVQRELVKLHFAIDAKTHALAIGKHRFTEMSSETKKEWFKNLSDNNYDYAINVFKALKDTFRDITGALKLARNKLVSQTSNLMPEDVLKALEKDCEELYKVVEFMIENRNSPSQPLEQTKSDIESKLLYLEKISTTVIQTVKKVECLLTNPIISSELSDVNDAASLAFFISNKLLDIKNKRSFLYEEYKSVKEIKELCEKTKLFQVANISTEIESLKNNLNQIKSRLNFKDFLEVNPSHHLKALQEFSPHLVQIALDLPENTDDKFSRNNYKTLITNLQEHQRDIEVNIANIKNYEESIAHHRQHSKQPDVKCPNCNHSFKPNFNADIAKDLEKKIFSLAQSNVFKQRQIDDIKEQLFLYDLWQKGVEEIKQIAYHYGFMSNFWNHLLNENSIIKNPKNIPNIVSLFKNDYELQEQLLLIEEKLNKEYEKLNLTQHTQGLDYQEALIRDKQISQELDFLAEQEIRFNSIKDLAQEIVKAVKSVQTLTVNILDTENQLDNLVETFNEDHLRNIFNNVLRSFHNELATKEKIINDEKSQLTILTNLQNEIKELEDQELALKLVLKELSPTEGIIAEGIYGFMKVFVKKMNKFISNVWTFPLEIKPCSAEQGKLELNYKFPLLVNNGEKARPDVSEGSRSMKEIIDLAFIICTLKSIGLSNSSLFLDEFGSAMDAVHKSKTAKMIETIVNNENFGQIFIISHDIAQYSALDNIEICILHKSNIIIPHGCIYNQHVIFE